MFNTYCVYIWVFGKNIKYSSIVDCLCIVEDLVCIFLLLLCSVFWFGLYWLIEKCFSLGIKYIEKKIKLLTISVRTTVVLSRVRVLHWSMAVFSARTVCLWSSVLLAVTLITCVSRLLVWCRAATNLWGIRGLLLSVS